MFVVERASGRQCPLSSGMSFESGSKTRFHTSGGEIESRKITWGFQACKNEAPNLFAERFVFHATPWRQE